jgi:hypothetical protein
MAFEGEEERVADGHLLVLPVWDHAEWTRLARNAEGGVLVTQAFVVRDETRGQYVTDPLEVEEALTVLAEHKRWPLTDVGGPLILGEEAPDVDSFGAEMEGGWWLLVPTDYLQDTDDDQRFEFRSGYGDREIVFWAFGAHVKRSGSPKLPQLEHVVEFALRGQTLYMHDEHSTALRYQA